MPVPKNKLECCGCSVCVNICPVNAINMVTDKEGFRYPYVNNNKCIQCEVCIKKCSFLNNEQISEDIYNKKEYFISQHKNEKNLQNSRSGAAFVCCSDYILSNEGIVYGSVLKPNMIVTHTRASTIEERNNMCGSKYVQSDIEEVLKSIEKDLKDNLVLFTGTSCEVDAVINYLNYKKINIDNLFTMDIICHGVPSPRIFKDYINYLEKKYKGKVMAFNFRDKEKYGWESHIESFIINNKKRYSTDYRKLFNSNNVLRPSCSNCKYTSLRRVSDITIGDAWGKNKEFKDLNIAKGLSIIMVNTKKGKILEKEIKNNSIWNKIEINNFMQPNLMYPTKPNLMREKFWIDYENKGFKKVLNKYARKSIYFRVKNAIKYYSKKLK